MSVLRRAADAEFSAFAALLPNDVPMEMDEARHELVVVPVSAVCWLLPALVVKGHV